MKISRPKIWRRLPPGSLVDPRSPCVQPGELSQSKTFRLAATAFVAATCALAVPAAWPVTGVSFSPPAAASSGSAAQETAAAAQVSFIFADPQVHPVRYALRVNENGSGKYQATAGGQLPDDDENSIVAPDQARAIRVSPATRERIFLLARRSKLFAMTCQAAGKVAFDGTKTLEYKGAEGQGSCTYTWTKDKNIEELTRIFEGIASTLDEGARLAVEHAHTPLALDPELNTLAGMAQRGEALELENIAPVLTAIADDDTVLKRDQSRARELLAWGKTQ